MLRYQLSWGFDSYPQQNMTEMTWNCQERVTRMDLMMLAISKDQKCSGKRQAGFCTKLVSQERIKGC